jgi:8-oxo-dGTP pyrophosphatase MutT (NUDIX family)
MPTMSKTKLFFSRQDLDETLATFINRSTQTPANGSLPLFISGFRCGWLSPAAAEALSGFQEVKINTQQADFGIGIPLGPELDTLLAELALTLKNAGCAPGWRNELLDVWTDESLGSRIAPTRIAAIERGAMRALGLTTRAVHLSGWSEDGRLWVAQRSHTKATDPGMWDTLVGGLVGNQEDPNIALLRESDEEAGLDAPDLICRTPIRTIAHMRRQIPEGFQTETVMTSECVLPQGVIPSNRDGEVAEIQLYDTQTIYNMLKQDAFTLEASIVITEDLWQRASDPV